MLLRRMTARLITSPSPLRAPIYLMSPIVSRDARRQRALDKPWSAAASTRLAGARGAPVGKHGRNGDWERGRRTGPYLAPKQKESAVKIELLPEPFSPPMKLICAQITELVVLLVTAAEGSRTACRARGACCASFCFPCILAAALFFHWHKHVKRGHGEVWNGIVTVAMHSTCMRAHACEAMHSTCMRGSLNLGDELSSEVVVTHEVREM